MPESKVVAPAGDDHALDNWVSAHPYLEPAAKLAARVDAVIALFPIPTASNVQWDDYAQYYDSGVPLLHGLEFPIDHDLGDVFLSVLNKLATSSLPGTLARDCWVLHYELQANPALLHSPISWLLGETSFSITNPGLLRYVGWSIVARSLAPLVAAFTAWRDEERWLRNYCPTCGSTPSMAQLVGEDPARLRLLFCGCCHTRWRYRRTACPFCEISNDDRLLSLSVEGERALRIDYCDVCRAYLKTYVGEGNEPLLLADWTSIHFDMIASDRGLKRSSGSIFQI